ncbi:Uncharacterised protein [Vibrio cholerae]|nr:Uncharacterised protein [Vibrio cholerae]
MSLCYQRRHIGIYRHGHGCCTPYTIAYLFFYRCKVSFL